MSHAVEGKVQKPALIFSSHSPRLAKPLSILTQARQASSPEGHWHPQVSHPSSLSQGGSQQVESTGWLKNATAWIASLFKRWCFEKRSMFEREIGASPILPPRKFLSL